MRRGIKSWAAVWFDVLVWTFPERKSTRLLDQFVSARRRFAQQSRQQVQAVRPFALSQGLSGKRSERSKEIDLANQSIGYPGLDPVRPARNERNARASFERAVLPSAQRSRRAMTVQFLHRLILVTVVDDRAVVAGDNHQRLPRELHAVEGCEDVS